MYQVLVIDDEEAVSKVLQLGLTRFGYGVKTAFGGHEGLRLFEEGIYDLVITDVLMHDLGGYEVARHIRQSHRPRTPIIAISGTPWLLESDDFDCVLAKPFSLKILAEAVEGVMCSALASRQALDTRAYEIAAE